MFFFLELFLKEGMKEIIYTTIQILMKLLEIIIILLYLTSILYVRLLELFLKKGEKGMKEIIYTTIQILIKLLEIIIILLYLTSVLYVLFFGIIFKRR